MVVVKLSVDMSHVMFEVIYCSMVLIAELEAIWEISSRRRGYVKCGRWKPGSTTEQAETVA